MSLIAWYKLDGDAVNSVTGNSGTTPYGTASFATGKIGQCGVFANTGVNVIHGEICNIVGNFTLSVWAKKNGTSTDAYGGVVSNFTSSTNKGVGLFFGDVIGNNAFYVDTGNGVRTYYPVTTPKLVTSWNHYSVVYNDGWVSSYFNGDLLDKRQLTIIFDPSILLGIGRWSPWNTAYNLNGNVDDVRVYDHALSAKEVEELSRAKILHYKFDDFQEPTTNLVASMATITPYLPYHTLTKTGNNISMTAVSEYTAGRVFLTMQCPAIFPSGIYQKYLSFSGYLKNNGKPISIEGTTISTYYQASGRFYFDTTSGYFEITQYYNTDTADWFMHCAVPAVVGDIITIDNFQIEEKYHNTPYTESSRTAMIRDYSDYGNHTTLADPDAPAWESGGKIGLGKYKFGKDSGLDRITLASSDIINCKRTVSISFWFKMNSWSAAYTTLFGKTDDAAAASTRTYTIFAKNDGSVLSFVTDIGLVGAGCYGSAGTITLGNWYNYVVTIDRDNGTINSYLNGVAYASNTISNLDNITHTYPLSIGERTNVYGPTNADIDDVRMYATALSATDVVDIYKSRGSIDSYGNLHTKCLVETNHTPLLLDYTSWQAGQTGSVGVFAASGSTAENRRLLGRDPWNKETVLWEAGADVTSDSDGGWNSSNITIDNTKTYRLSCWIKRSVSGNGFTYLGTNSSPALLNATTGVANGNPYFMVNIPSNNDWFLYVGHIRPVGYIGDVHQDSGMYSLDGIKVYAGNYIYDFAFVAGSSWIIHRSYLYYSTDLTTRQQFVYPRVDLCDGNEPTITELLDGHDSRNVDLIRSIGATNPINMHVGPITHVNTISELGPTESLLAYYPLDGDILDYSGGNFHGTTNTGAIVAPGLNNKKCYQFNGTSDKILCGYIESSVNPTNSSWSVWCYPHTHTNPSINTIWGTYLPYLGMIPTGQFRFSANISGTQRVLDTVSSHPDNAWYHLVFTYDGTYIRGYLNGDYQGGSSYPGYFLMNSSRVLSIGHWSNLNTDTYFFDGKIQDMRVYNKTLTSEEIMTLYQVTNPVTTKLKINKRRVYLGGKIKETF